MRTRFPLKSALIIRIACGTVIVSTTTSLGSPSADQGVQTNLTPAEMLASSAHAAWTQGETLLTRERSSQVSRLVQVLEDRIAKRHSLFDYEIYGVSPSSRTACVTRALGVLRAPEAVPILFRCLTSLDWWDSQVEHGPLPWPAPKNDALESLIKIGKPSSKAALERLKNCADGERGLLVEVIKGVEGEAVARFIVRNAISEAKTADEKAALQKAADILGPDTK